MQVGLNSYLQLSVFKNWNKVDMKKYKTGIVLSGGGARGFAHLGALQALHENRIYPEIISGVSAGAIVGAFYAHGMSPIDIMDLLKSKGIFNYSKFNLPINGLLTLTGLIDVIKENISCDRIENLSKPAVFTATNLNTGLAVRFDHGKLSDVIAASSCIPILFSPITIDNHQYVDGGVFDNFPSEPIRSVCDKLIGINISPINESSDFGSLSKIATRIFQLSVNATSRHGISMCDMVIEPKGLSAFGILDSSAADQLFELGYDAAVQQLKQQSLED